MNLPKYRKQMLKNSIRSIISDISTTVKQEQPSYALSTIKKSVKDQIRNMAADSMSKR